MAPDAIFDFWSQIGRGEKIHPADKDVFRRIDPKKHGFQLKCLPACFGGPLQTAPLVLLYLSPGFREDMDLADAKTNQGKDYYFRRWKGYEPLLAGRKWVESRTKCFGKWGDLHDKVAILNIGAYHSTTFNDYSLLAALPSSRVSLEWAQSVLFPEAEAGNRMVLCMRAASYWGLERGRSYGKGLFAPRVTRGGHLAQGNEKLIEKVRSYIKIGL